MLELVSHAWHWLAGLISPCGWHVPETRQLPAATTLVQTSPLSLHASFVHERPSLQLRAAPTQVALAVHASLTVQKRPSSHAVPVRAVHAELLLAAMHAWQKFDGLIDPSG